MIRPLLLLFGAAIVAPDASELPAPPPTVQIDDCADPAKGARILEQMWDHTLPQAKYLWDMAGQSVDRSDARQQALADKARWSDKQIWDFKIVLGDDAEIMSADEVLVKPWVTISFGRIPGKYESEEKFCRAVVESLNETVPQAQELTDRQWKRTVELIEAEAKKLGVSLPN